MSEGLCQKGRKVGAHVIDVSHGSPTRCMFDYWSVPALAALIIASLA